MCCWIVPGDDPASAGRGGFSMVCLGDEDAADSRALADASEHVGLAQHHANGGQNWHVKYGAKLVGQILGLIELQCNAAIAQIDDLGRLLFRFAEQGVSLS